MSAEHALSLDTAVDRVLSLDREPAETRQYLLRIQHESSGDKPDYRLATVNFSDPNDEIGTFLKLQESTLIEYIDNPKLIPIPEKTARGTSRSKREKNNIRKSKLKDYKFELAVIRGDIMAPITIIELTKRERRGEGHKYYGGYSISRESL